MLDTENGTPRAIAKLLDDECDPNDRAAWQTGTPTDWANESLALMIEYVYPLPESHAGCVSVAIWSPWRRIAERFR